MLIAKLFRKIFGNRNSRVIKKCRKTVEKINSLEAGLRSLSDVELQAKTPEFRRRLEAGASLDALLPEAFAVVREASRRVLHMRHFDVQLIGGMVLHQGCIAEMRTGEGKTLMATLAVYLNALPGKGVHIVTVNDYLAKRDAEWMRPLYEFLGLSVGIILSDMTPQERQKAYAADVTYGTNNEFGFDYLRDNMALNVRDRVQRELYFSIVDEVDSILIDEARTPLIISGALENNSQLYAKMNAIVPHLRPQQKEGDAGDFVIDEKTRQVYLTEAGHVHVEKLLSDMALLEEGQSLYNAVNITLMHHLNAALRAHHLFHRDVDYIVKNAEVVIVDEHTGRTMPGRRWSEGLHQAVEAKESVTIRNENQTLASITFQNYFRLYEKLAGMTGTADTEAYEFQQIYGLEVVVIPTNKPMIRKDTSDFIYLNTKGKYTAIIEDIKQCVSKGQPVLVGTASIETSEYVSDLLRAEKIPHQVLNAKFHEKEAQIIAEAGRPGAVTIATNMAGRGTDIVLGGNLDAELTQLGEEATEAECDALKAQWQQRHQQVIAAGGLHVIGTERHESRRIDNQLRGRSGRQGDPGSSRFYLSLEDSLLRIFASDRVAGFMQRLGMQENQPIEHPWVTKAIENAQRKVEGRNFDIRKQLLEFDDVANEQRKIIYRERKRLLEAESIETEIHDMRAEVVQSLVSDYVSPMALEEEWDLIGLQHRLENDFAVRIDFPTLMSEQKDLHAENLSTYVLQLVEADYQRKEAQLSSQVMRHFERAMMLQCLDNHWREHLAAMDYLRQGIHLRGYAQKDPKQEYKRESFFLFKEMLENMKYAVISFVTATELRTEDELERAERLQREASEKVQLNFEHQTDLNILAANEEQKAEEVFRKTPENKREKRQETVEPFVRSGAKIGRNTPCPCGSGKKYKHCHGSVVTNS